MTDEGARALAAAVCLQAIKDYEALCRKVEAGKIIELPSGALEKGPTFRQHRRGNQYVGDHIPNYSFREIEQFFVRDGEQFAGFDPKHILDRLYKQKARAKWIAAKKFGRNT